MSRLLQKQVLCTMELDFKKSKVTIVRHWAGGFPLFLHDTIWKKSSENVKPKMKKIGPADLQKSLETKKMFFFASKYTTYWSLICLVKNDLTLITRGSTMEFKRYTNFFYYFGNIKIQMLRKKERIKRIIANVRDSICYSSADEQSVNF